MTSVFAALLRLYPRPHREKYGDEMIAVVRYRWEKEGRTIRAGFAGTWDLAAGAVGVWTDRLGRGAVGMGRGWSLDVRFVARSLWKSKGYVATTVVVLACAVASNAAVFSYVRGTLLATPPYPDPESLVIVWGSNVVDGQLRDVISGPSFVDLQEQSTAFQAVAALHADGTYLMVNGRPEVLSAHEVSVDFFDVVGVAPWRGRLFDERDRMSGAAQTVVVTYAFWRDRMGADPDALGSVLSLEDDPREVIGILPEGFEFTSPAPLFIPLRDDALAAMDRGNIHYHVLGRLREGVSVEDANRDARTVMAGIIARNPSHQGWSFLVERFHEVSVEAVRPTILALTFAVGLVMLVALVNLATLFRIRAFARGDELAVRAALGAGRARVTRVLALETVGLALAGGVLGLLATPVLVGRISAMLPVWIAIPDSAARLPVLTAILDPAVASVALGSAVLGSLLLTAPAFRTALQDSRAPSSRRSVHPGLRGTRWLVGVQVAVGTMLCIGAGLTARSTNRLLATDLGVRADGLLTMYVGDIWDRTAEERVSYFRQVVEAVESVPGVTRAGVMGYVDFWSEDDYAHIYFLDREGNTTHDLREEWRRVDEGLFETAGMRIVRGRGFERIDFQATPAVAVVNASFAAKHYPDGDAVGSLLSTHSEAYRDLRIVGVVADVRSLGPAADAPPMLYVPYQGDPRGTQGLYVRVTGSALQWSEPVREAVWSVDSSQPIFDDSAMSDLVGMWVAVPRATRALVGLLATLAWVLAAVGLFGVVAYTVRTRRAELGIRLALGASPNRLEADQLKAIAPIVVLGLSAGLAFGVAGAEAARGILRGISPLDPISLVGAVVAMGAATLAATWLPARRAGRVDPREVIAPQ